jgi:hypothetical protein
MAWSDLTPQEKQDAVRHAVQTEGLTYGMAAAQLGTTRLAVAGVIERTKKSANPIVSRSGAGNNAVKARRPPKKQKFLPKAKHAGLRSYISLPHLPIDQAAPARTDVWSALPGSTPVSVDDYTGGCRWPINEDRPFRFCGEPVEQGPYCPQHHHIAYKPLPSKSTHA